MDRAGTTFTDIFLVVVNAFMDRSGAGEFVDLGAVRVEGAFTVHVGQEGWDDLGLGAAAQLERADFAAAFDQGQDGALVASATRTGMLTLTVLFADIGFVGFHDLAGPAQWGLVLGGLHGLAEPHGEKPRGLVRDAQPAGHLVTGKAFLAAA